MRILSSKSSKGGRLSGPWKISILPRKCLSFAWSKLFRVYALNSNLQTYLPVPKKSLPSLWEYSFHQKDLFVEYFQNCYLMNLTLLELCYGNWYFLSSCWNAATVCGLMNMQKECRKETYSTWYLSSSRHPPSGQNQTLRYSSGLDLIHLADMLLLVP